MKSQRKLLTWKTAIGTGFIFAIASTMWTVYANRPRDLAIRKHEDGTSRVIVAKPRLLGMMGIEIVMEDRAADGSRRYGSVQDLLGSWDEVFARYGNADGGGLLRSESSRNEIRQ